MEKAAKGGFPLSFKEILVIAVSTALALGSLAPADPYIIIPMLAISGTALVILCVRHTGSPTGRTVSAIFIALVLFVIGWRSLEKASQPAAPSITIDQKAVDSNCSNVVAKGDVKIDCTSTEKNGAQPKP